MRAIIVLIFWTISLVLPTNQPAIAVVVIPPMPHVDPWTAVINDETHPEYDVDADWYEFEVEAYDEALHAFTDLFNSYTYKRSANGRSMINGKFVKMGA